MAMEVKDLSVGIDIGTTSVKAIVISNAGKILYEMSLQHDVILKKPGYAEEDPNLWWKNTMKLLTDIASNMNKKRIGAIGFSGMVPTLILVDEQGMPLYNSIQQNDTRATDEIQAFKDEIDEERLFQQTGNTINQQVIFPKYRWMLKHYSHLVKKSRYIMGSYNYCTYLISGVPTLELNWALESGLWLIKEKEWNTEVLEKAEISHHILPPVYAPEEVVGETSRDIERETGFPAGVPVIAGSADHVASALASGVQEEGDLLLKVGGAGDILLAIESIQLDKRLFIDYHDLKDKYLLNGCMASSGAIVKWFSNQFNLLDFEQLTQRAQKINPGSDGLILLPYFLGEKTPIFDVNARGVFFGLSLFHTKYHMFRAILESVAYGFMHHIEIFQELGYEIRNVYLSNGGARSDIWKQILVDVVGHDGIYLPEHPGSCLGVALLAAEATGISKNWENLDRFVERGIRIPFSKENHRKYQEYFQIYKQLYLSLKPLFKNLRDIERH